MRKLRTGILIGCLVGIAAGPALADGVSAQAAFERLTSLEGTWKGKAVGEGEEAEAAAAVAHEIVHAITLSAGGTVVMETMGPGSPDEMINVYHLDGDDLLLTHYCSSGNQPRMRLDREASTLDRLVFAYDGGTNHDPAVDHHIHSAEIRTVADDRIESDWSAWTGGEQVGRMVFHLARSDG